jgi:hypothetical protein
MTEKALNVYEINGLASESPINIYERFVSGEYDKDTEDSNTKLLVHFNGTDGQQTYTAETGQTVTFVSTAQLDIDQQVFGSSSLILDGNSDYVSVPDSTDWNFGTGDFTFECWVRFNQLPADGTYTNFIEQYVDSNNRFSFIFNRSGGSWISFHCVNGGVNKGSANCEWYPDANIWYHVAAIRSSLSPNFTMLFVNGNQQGYDTIVTWLGASMPELSAPLCIGARPGSRFINGWIDEVRISNVARWTTDFTPNHDTGGLNIYERS